MRSWGKQAFLNPVSSVDSGYIKFSIKRKDSKEKKNDVHPYSIKFRIADCSEHIELDFDINSYCYGDVTAEDYRKMLGEIKQRRAKAALLADSVRQFAEKLNETYDEAEEAIVGRLKCFEETGD